MRKRQIFQALVFGFVLAITGCSSDPENGGNGGSGGSGGSTGFSSCDAICAGTCVIFDGTVDPNSATCASACTTITDPDGQLNDTCGTEMAGWVDCAEAEGSPPDCDFNPFSCPTEFAAWDDCSDFSAGTGGTGGTGGSAGTGGSGGAGGSGGSAGPDSSCDAICDGPCVLLGVIDPDSPDCATECTQATDPVGGLDDECGPEMAELLACGAAAEACGSVFELLFNCEPQWDAWDCCNDPELCQ
jgi:hypothetical protein